MSDVENRLNAYELKAKLAQKKQQVIEMVKGIEKTGNNTAQKYKYAEEAEVVKQIRAAFNKVGIAFSVSASDYKVTHEIPTKYSKMANIAIAMTCTLTDSVTGYSEESTWLGAAADSGDKALYKAFTGGIKYFLLKTFLLPTGDDPEAFDHEEPDDKKPPKKPTPKQTTTKPTQKDAFWKLFGSMISAFEKPKIWPGNDKVIDEILIAGGSWFSSNTDSKYEHPTATMTDECTGYMALAAFIAGWEQTPEKLLGVIAAAQGRGNTPK